MNPQNGHFTLLIVDDDKHNRLLLTELFEGEYKIIQAKNGLQALERARAHAPDLILLDVLMPEMDGMAVIRALKRDDATRHIPVIFITALDSAADEELGLDLGAVDYIAKPFHPPIARVRVRNHLQIVHQRRLLEQIAALDGLTGIPNRRHFDETLATEWKRCLRLEAPLSLIISDVDFFKQFNDIYGHQAGDACLRAVAGSLCESLFRVEDTVARYGGEEFAAILPGTDIDGALAVAERMRRSACDLRIPHERGIDGLVSCSFGVASLTPGSADTPLKLLQTADSRLYAAKREGRNRVLRASA